MSWHLFITLDELLTNRQLFFLGNCFYQDIVWKCVIHGSCQSNIELVSSGIHVDEVCITSWKITLKSISNRNSKNVRYVSISKRHVLHID